MYNLDEARSLGFRVVAMPFPMKVQPLDSDTQPIRHDPAKPVLKSRLKRLFDRQFPSVLKTSSSATASAADKPYSAAEQPPPPPPPPPQQHNRDVVSEFEPSSVWLDDMVQNFYEGVLIERPSAAKLGRTRCSCFNGNGNSSDDDDLDAFREPILPTASSGDAFELLKILVPCASAAETNLLAEIGKIVEKNKICKPKDEYRGIVANVLSSLSYDASVCTSRWEKSKSPSYLAGEYEFIDVVVEGENLLVDIDFRSEFEIARPTKAYRAILQSLPYIFVGKSDRLQQLVSVVADAAKQSLRKKGLHVPPWRNPEYMRAKWLSPRTRATLSPPNVAAAIQTESDAKPVSESEDDRSGGSVLVFGDQLPPPQEADSGALQQPLPSPSPSLSEANTSAPRSATQQKHDGDKKPAMTPWQPPAVVPKTCQRGAKIVTGLASLLKERT